MPDWTDETESYGDELPGWNILGDNADPSKIQGGGALLGANTPEGANNIVQNMQERQGLRENIQSPMRYDQILQNLGPAQSEFASSQRAGLQQQPQSYDNEMFSSSEPVASDEESQGPTDDQMSGEIARMLQPQAPSQQQMLDASNAAGGGMNSLGTPVGGKVLCTLAYLHDYISFETYMADCRYSMTVDSRVKEGYWMWAKPLVRFLKKRPSFMPLVMPFVQCWAKYMAYEMKESNEFSYAGYLLNAVGTRLCKALSYFKQKESIYAFRRR